MLDDDYIYWGCTWDSHLCNCINKIVSFSASVHQEHKEFYVGGEVSQIFNFGLGFFNFQWSGMIYTSSVSFYVMLNFMVVTDVWEHAIETLGPYNSLEWKLSKSSSNIWILTVEEIRSMNTFV